MELSIHNWMRAESIETTIGRISALGYEKIEIQGTPEAYDTKYVGQLLKDHNMTCWGSVTLMLEDRNLLAKNKAQRAKSVQYVKDVVTMVKELDGKMVSVVPATVGKIIPDGRPEEEWEWAVEGMKEIYAYSESVGILLGIEPINRFETYFINRGDQALALAKAVGPNCGVCLDSFHMNIEEADMAASIKASGDFVIHVHFVDSNRRPVGNGHSDFSEVAKVLKQINYTGFVSAEAFAWPNSEAAATQTIQSFNQYFKQ
jgi:sugar phosphate isomerase/epimerase